MKKLLIVLGGLVVVAFAAGAMLPRLLDMTRYHDRMEAGLQQSLGRHVQLGQMSLGLLPPRFKVQNAVIGEDPKYDSGMPFAQMAELDIRVKLGPLLHKELRVESLQMVRPQLELIRGMDGAWNFSTIGTHNKQQTKEEQASGQNPPLQLDRVEIVDGAVAITDQRNQQPRMQYKDIDVTLRNYGPGKEFAVALSAHLPGASKQVVKFDGHGGPIEDATLVTTPFEGSLQLEQVELGGVQQFLHSQALEGFAGVIGGNLKFVNNAGKVSAAGTIKMENVVAHGTTLGFPIELDCNASDDLEAGAITVSNTQLKIGRSTFVINGMVNGKSAPVLADLKLNAQDASLADLVKLAEAGGMQLSPGSQPSGQMSADLTATGPLRGPAVAGTLKATKLKLSGVEANNLLVTLTMAPAREHLVKTLTGRVSVIMTNGQLTGVDMSQKLGEIGKFTGVSKASQGATNVLSLTGDFDLKNGVASTNNLKALTDTGAIAATGTASLVDQQLDMKATAVLSKQSSQQVGGAGIGGMTTTEMANENGEIVMPVLVTGTIPSPKVESDVSVMARMRTSGLLPSFRNPGQLNEGSLAEGGAGGAAEAPAGKTLPGAVASNQQQNGNATQNAVSESGGLSGGTKNPKQ
jgi:uncharacterized protein involved in outer membrane biogenesis